MTEGRKPLLIDSKKIRPLDKHLWGIACEVCDKTQSRWHLVADDQPTPICALCFLYESGWGKKRHVELAEYLNDVLASNPKRKMILSPEGKLTNVDDADFILGILALTSRQFEVDDQKAETPAP